MKKALYILLALCLVLTLAACGEKTPAVKGNGIESDHKHCACVGNAKNVGAHTECLEAAGWVAVGTTAELLEAIEGAATTPAWVYLTADIAFENMVDINPGAKVNICLNGKTMTGMFRNYAAELNVTDCTGKGTWTSDRDYTMRGFSGSVTNLYAGNFTISDASEETQVLTIEGGAVEEKELEIGEVVLNIYGGKIFNPNKTGKNGANIWLGGNGTTTVTLYNGEVGPANAVVPDNNEYRLGGSIAVYGHGATFKMYNGLVHGGKIDSGKDTSNGGNIGAYRGAIEIYGGTIKDGYSSGNGGNISTGANSCSKLVIENATVTGGYAGKFGGNVYVHCGDVLLYATMTANLKNSTFSDGTARSGGNIFLQGGYFTVIEDCKITGAKATDADNAEMAAGIAVQGADNLATNEGVMVITLKGNNVFDNVKKVDGKDVGCDILMRQYKTTKLCSQLSIAGITGTDDIVLAGNGFTYAYDITSDNNANAASILKAADDFTLVENNGVWNLSVAETPAA